VNALLRRSVDLIDALLSQHKFEEAERPFADVLPPERELQSKYANLLFERCNTYARCGRWRKAAEDAAILLKHSPDNHECYNTLALLQVRLVTLRSIKSSAGRFSTNSGDHQHLCR